MILQPPHDIDPFLDPIFIAKNESLSLWMYFLLSLVIFLLVFFLYKIFKRFLRIRNRHESMDDLKLRTPVNEFVQKKVFEKISQQLENYLTSLNKKQMQEFEAYLRFFWYAQYGMQVFSWTQEEWKRQLKYHPFFTNLRDEESFCEFLDQSEIFLYQNSDISKNFVISESAASLFRRMNQFSKSNGAKL